MVLLEEDEDGCRSELLLELLTYEVEDMLSQAEDEAAVGEAVEVDMLEAAPTVDGPSSRFPLMQVT